MSAEIGGAGRLGNALTGRWPDCDHWRNYVGLVCTNTGQPPSERFASLGFMGLAMLNFALRPGIVPVATQGKVMSFRTNAMNCGAGTALALALTLATTLASPAVAANNMPLPPAPDIRPEWRPEWRGASTSAILLPDSRTRDAWLRECRRRTAYYYDNGGYYRRGRHHDRDRGHIDGYAPGYDYCEAYFDDYYRTYTQRGYAFIYPVPTYQSATTYQSGQRQVEEVLTERYEPIRSRIIERRRARPVIHDKRIRVAP
jgi:hypothetical protein